MDKDRLNNMVVDLFHGISYEEEKAVITDEFKDISNKDLHIIDAIGIKKPKNMSTIAGDLNITVGTLTTAINNLLKKGYVNRKRGEKDRRVVYISLSEKGRKAYLSLIHIFRQIPIMINFILIFFNLPANSISTSK